MKNNKAFVGLAAITVAALLSFNQIKKAQVTTADSILINGKIITVDAAGTIQQAIAIRNGRILAVGTVATIQKLKGPQTEVIDLKGKTVIPGLIDGHSHFMALERQSYADLNPPPVGRVNNIADIVKVLLAYKTEHHVKDGELIRGFGYDQDQLTEHRHPTKEDLDAAFPNNPVVLSHVSGHMVVANSQALKISNITASTVDPAGGKIVRKEGTNEPAGLLQEGASRLLRLPEIKNSPEQRLELLKAQQLFYASYGITTAQDGLSSYESVELLRRAADEKKLFIDIESLPSYQIVDKVLGDSRYKFNVLENHLKLQGFKLVADGSPQGKTAFFTKPFLTPVPGCDQDCHGFPNITQDIFNQAVIKGYKNNVHIFVHCNGDAAIDMYIKAVNNANALVGNGKQRRSVIIHSQFARPDQLDEYKKLGMVPAFFTNHAFFWGDVHTQNLGKERAFFLSPLKTAIKKGITFTNHTDYPVTPINQMFLLWTAVNRQSRSGETIGPDEKVTPLEGLRAITINGAYQNFEEKDKGSIEKGKLADLAILSADPLTIKPDAIKDILVLETIKEGKTIYKRQ